MTSNVLHTPQAVGFRTRRLIYVALGLLAVVVVVAVMVLALSSSAGPKSSTGDELGGAVPPGSGISFGRSPAPGH
jgi:hypothetical protein